MLALLKGRLIEVRVILLIAALTLTAIGIGTIYAVGHPKQIPPPEVKIDETKEQLVEPSNDPPVGEEDDSNELSSLWKKQLAFAGLGLAALIAINLVWVRQLGQAGYWIYALVLVLLGVLLVDKIVDLPFVPLINGARRWLRLSMGPVSLNLQPSELCKPAYVLALAWYLRYRSNYRRLRGLIGPFILTLLPMAMILLEPDLGTVLLMMPLFFVMLFVAGAKVKHLLLIILACLAVSPLLWFRMQPYQRLRISSVFLQNDWLRQKAEGNSTLAGILVGGKFSERKWRSGWGYHLIRSKYAVASGGTGGYGFGEGPFVKYNFLPERHNDFIFAIIAHQWGFVGCIIVLGLYLIIFLCGLEIAVANTDPFARLLAVGIVTIFAIQVIVNVAMTLGLMPITGITLPFVSYGGSSLLVSLLCVGLLNNVGRWRPFTVAPRRVL